MQVSYSSLPKPQTSASCTLQGLFYSSSPKLDVDLLTEPWGEDLEIERQENNAKEKKRGRPKGSKNKKGKGKKKSVNRKQTKSAKNRNKTA